LGQGRFCSPGSRIPCQSVCREQYGIFGQPIVVLIRPDGSEIQRWFGRIDLNATRQALDAVQTG
jgi:hypothetical protein